jgi:F0F1-type ATP synthase delta subunit
MTVSRRKLVRAVVDRMESHGSKQALSELAAYIVDHRLTKQAGLIISDIERELAARGRVVARVSAARPLDDSTRTVVLDYIKKHTSARDVTLHEHTDESLIGGVLVNFNGQQLDTTVKTKLKRLKTL